MKQQRYISILDTFSWNKLQIDVADIFHILKLKKTTMIASYEEGVIGVEQAKHLLDELEKLQYLWCLVEQNVSLTLDQFKHNLMHSTATNWVLIRQEIASLSCDQNLRFFPYLKIGNELYLVWLILKTLMQSPSSNDYQPYLYLPLNTNVTLALSTEVSSSKHLQHHIYLEVLLRLKQYLSTTSYLPNYDTPALPPQVTTEKLFDTLLERYQSLYCLSLNIQLPFKSSKMVDYHAFIQDLNRTGFVGDFFI